MTEPLHETPEYLSWVESVNARTAEINRRIRTSGGNGYFCKKTGKDLFTRIRYEDSLLAQLESKKLWTADPVECGKLAQS